MATKAITKKNAAVKKAVPKKKKAAAVKVNHIISKRKGAEMVNRFRTITNLNTISFSHGMEFNKSIFEKLLKLKGVTKIRVYNAVNENGEHTFVLTAVDAKRNDIYFKLKRPATKSTSKAVAKLMPGEDEGVGNMGNQCPAYEDTIKSL
jgi:hypothetical protein